MAIDKNIANRVLTNLDHTAAKIEKLAAAGKIEPRVAAELVRDLDAFADNFQVAAFGAEKFAAHKAKVAKVLQRDSDEKFMDTFSNPNKLIEGDSDEGFMKEFNTDNSSDVTDRDEHQVRDLNEYADGTKKQPSWARGPAGKSTRSAAQAAPVKPAKRWAP